MTSFLTIKALLEEGVPKKAIARRLGVDARTVRKYARRIAEGEGLPVRRSGPSKLDDLDGVIRHKVEQGLSAVQIHQDLSRRADFSASYATVRRRVRELRRREPAVFCRLRFDPGEEAQIDFGSIGHLLVGGERRSVYVFVLTLCFSRLSYYELVTDQKVATFLGAIGRAFEWLGGAPRRLKPDNLRSAVLLGALGERYYQEDFFRFCRHYGVVPDAARPHTPTDKGRVEREIGYVKGNCFRGRDLLTLEEAREHLARWAREVACVRLHRTTGRRPQEHFEDERGALSALPAERYEVCDFGRYRVRKDCHISVLGNFYSVPYAHVGEKVLVRISETHVVISAGEEQVADHERATGHGCTVTNPSHYPREKRLATQEIHRRRTLAVRAAGVRSAEYLSALRAGRWVYGDQLGRMASLLAAYGEEALERACERALHFGATSGARTLERILERGLQERPLPSSPSLTTANEDFPRALREYDELLALAGVA